MSRAVFRFPKWSNLAVLFLLAAVPVAAGYVAVLVGYGADPTTLNVGYQPVQPIPYSHALHAGKLGIDCRYCHTTVEKAGMAALPSTEICMNCHKGIKPDSPLLGPLRESYASGKPIKWLKVNGLPDYVYFNHSAHVNGGIGCIECHGPVHQMEVVRQVKPLSMAWCLECHRSPDATLRPRDQVTNMNWTGPESQADREELGKQLRKTNHVDPNTDCVSCHR